MVFGNVAAHDDLCQPVCVAGNDIAITDKLHILDVTLSHDYSHDSTTIRL